MDRIIIIAGATASSKTATAVSIAKRINGEIISADSMQIYRGMDIGTAKVTSSEMDGIPHHLIDVVNYTDNFTVAQYAKLAREAIDDIISRGKLPIICGGTGLYIDSVIYPFDFGNDRACDNSIKLRLMQELEEHGAEYLHDKLKEIDIDDANKIHPNNTKRLIRALEIFYSTGKSKTSQGNKEVVYDVDMTALEWDREELYSRIDKRVQVMFDNGLISEINRVVTGIESFELQSMSAIGYREFKDYCYGKLSLDEVKELITKNSRHYAKRQLTWLRKYDFAKWMTPSKCIEYYMEKYGILN